MDTKLPEPGMNILLQKELLISFVKNILKIYFFQRLFRISLFGLKTCLVNVSEKEEGGGPASQGHEKFSILSLILGNLEFDINPMLTRNWSGPVLFINRKTHVDKQTVIVLKSS